MNGSFSRIPRGAVLAIAAVAAVFAVSHADLPQEPRGVAVAVAVNGDDTGWGVVNPNTPAAS